MPYGSGNSRDKLSPKCLRLYFPALVSYLRTRNMKPQSFWATYRKKIASMTDSGLGRIANEDDFCLNVPFQVYSKRIELKWVAQLSI